jgi:hypothetical protein
MFRFLEKFVLQVNDQTATSKIYITSDDVFGTYCLRRVGSSNRNNPSRRRYMENSIYEFSNWKI